MSAFYSIKDLEKLSGIKAHTIRIWEQRYGILQAERTATNIRVYNDNELKQLMSLALLNRKGIKISKLAKLSEKEMQDLVEKMLETPSEFETHIEGLVMATLDYDDQRFEKILNTSILQLGFEETIKRVIFPFLEKIGIMWISGSLISAQEHFVSQLIRQKVIVAIDGQMREDNSNTKTYLLFLPNKEYHELSLLFLNYLLRSRKQRVVYLGASVQLKDVLKAGEDLQPDYFYTIITSHLPDQTVEEYLNQIADKFPNSIVYASGIQINTRLTGLRENVVLLTDMKSVLNRVEQIAA
ncbi:MAG: MerR family transcriptional regulator [Chitinophagales bacterium]